MSSKRGKTPVPKKQCESCGKDRAYTFYYKVDSPLFPDGAINTCRDCIRKDINIDDTEQVIGFLRQIDKPFYQDEWNKALEGKNHPIGSYMQKINGLQQYKGKTFSDSDGVDGIGNVDISSINAPDTIKTDDGKQIEYSDELVDKWGIGYSKFEYLQMEKFFYDMKATHEIYTPLHIDMLKQLAYLSVDRDNLRRKKDWQNYKRVNDAYEDIMISSGFRPIDRKGGAEGAGIFSFSEVWSDVEKDGFVLPDMVEYPKDDLDHMLLYHVQFAQRLVGKSVSTKPNEKWREEVDLDDD